MYTDISFEIFNSCAGSCTGCSMSYLEKKNYKVKLNEILIGIDKIREYSLKTNTKYRVIFSFADIPKMNWDEQEIIYKKCLDNSIQFGLTLALVDETFDYFNVIKKIIKINPDVIFDLTLDPIRLENIKFKKYRENIVNFSNLKIKKHIQILLSTYILEKFSPKQLYDHVVKYIGDNNVFMSFSPTIQKFNTEKLQKYNFENCMVFVKSFYNSSDVSKKFLAQELIRNNNHGSYEHFMKLVFHIDDSLNVYNQVYSLYGDLIQDKRNLITPLGNLKNKSLDEILNSNEVKKISIKNKLYLETSNFNCNDCDYIESCNYNGIGLAIHLYKTNKRELKNCYGPKNILNELVK